MGLMQIKDFINIEWLKVGFVIFATCGAPLFLYFSDFGGKPRIKPTLFEMLWGAALSFFVAMYLVSRLL